MSATAEHTPGSQGDPDAPAAANAPAPAPDTARQKTAAPSGHTTRRTFAIISHPDAGKTTLTEKLLLAGGAIEMAGNVRAKGNGRRAKSDWMDIEKSRGISVTSSVMTFERDGITFNLLDTPGHSDFLRGHLPHPHRGRQRHHGHRRRQGHRGADPQALRDLPPARHPDRHLHQQGRPRGPRPVRTARRDRGKPAAAGRARRLAGRPGRPVQGLLRSGRQRLPSSPARGRVLGPARTVRRISTASTIRPSPPPSPATSSARSAIRQSSPPRATPISTRRPTARDT